ncbi:organic cation transporter protein-like [Centruroides sculpturatus]|uniref:organic cation transporter protein-like n=1 Tax=Centruroides sculpturatus TaxID=218467 RepID=UPI000C6D44C8|nr:organic cation transporter protein-like [Centruroides sculpturatus]
MLNEENEEKGAKDLVPYLNHTTLMKNTMDTTIENTNGSPEVEETAEKFQDFTDLIGTFGRWQKILFGVMAWIVIVSALNNLNWPFLAYKVDYWCARTPKYVNVSVEEWKNISAPLEIRNGRTMHSRCEVYDIDDIKYGKNFSKIPCRSWEYDHSQYKNSVIQKWNLVCESSWLSSLAGSSFFMGFLVSAIVSGQISDRYGRRPVIISGLVLHLTFGILCSFSPYYWMFTVSRFFLSAGRTAFSLTFYVYVMEVIGPSYRDKLMVLLSVFSTTGTHLLTGVSWFLKDWTYIQLSGSLPSIITLLFISYIPESPRWLLTHGRLRKAEDVIRNIMEKNKRHTEHLTEIIEELCWKIRTHLWSHRESEYYGFFKTDLIWLRVAFLVLCTFCVSIEMSTIYAYTLELYPTVVRNVGIGSCSTFARIGAIAAPFMKDLSEKVYWSIPFIIVGVLTLSSGLCILPLPETKDIRLHDIIVK